MKGLDRSLELDDAAVEGALKALRTSGDSAHIAAMLQRMDRRADGCISVPAASVSASPAAYLAHVYRRAGTSFDRSRRCRGLYSYGLCSYGQRMSVAANLHTHVYACLFGVDGAWRDR